MHIFSIISDLRFQDILDILFLTVVAYYLYLWFRGTKAYKALVGLVALGVVYTVADTWGFFLTTWVFQLFWQVLVILLIILFQSEIRQVLERVNPLKAFGLSKISGTEPWTQAFGKGVFELARQKIGALVIIERTDRVDELVTGGQALETEPTVSILMSIFQKKSPLHDGAVLIKSGRITQVTNYLPLSSSEGLPKTWGTRHRAALGLSERSDAWIVLVSEESGGVAIARGGKLEPVKDAPRMSQMVLEAIKPLSPPPGKWWEKARFLLINRWPAKTLSLTLVCALWLMLAGQQNFEVSLNIPVELENLSETMQVAEPLNPEVKVTIRGLRKDASTLRKENVRAYIDLTMARTGIWYFRVTRDQIVLTNDRLFVVNIKPSEFKFDLKEKLVR